MHVLHEAGVDSPRPIARSERAILMQYMGDAHGPAPKLNDVELEPADVARITDRLLWNVEVMLNEDRVHGDLSAFNILYWHGAATIIDFPQAIDPRLNSAGQVLLARDVENVCKWAAKASVKRDADAISRKLWSRFVLGEIG
jgi:RIO kinase 1